MPFVHLHVHSQFSILNGTAKPAELAARAAMHGMAACALTDTANLFAAVAWHKACKQHGIQPILGAELTVQPQGIAYADPRGVEGGYNVVLLVENAVGYRNLCELITASIFEGLHYKPRIDLEGLKARSNGLILLTGGPKGVLGAAQHHTDPELGPSWLAQLAQCFDPEHLYLELQDLGLPGQAKLNDLTRELSQKTGYQTVVTNAVHYLDAIDAPVHETLHAIAMGHSLTGEKRLVVPTDQAYFKSEAEIKDLFPDDLDAIDRTGAIAARCDYAPTFGTYHFPATDPPDTAPAGAPEPDTQANWAYFYRAFPPPSDYGLPDPSGPDTPIPPAVVGAGNLAGYFDWYAKTGLEQRLTRVPADQHSAYRARLQIEIAIIKDMGFPAYMLIVAEFINWSKDHGIPVGPGRGSAAGSLVAYAMRITDIDPIRYGLLFERFLNPARVSMPDIDVDFSQDGREKAIEHVRAKYGTDRVSQIITYGTLKAKAAIRDVARVLNLSFRDSDRLSKMVPDELGITLGAALKQVDSLRALHKGDPRIRRVIDTALRLEGTVRQTGVHAAGVVIADKPLVHYAPLYRIEPEGGPVVQFDMKSAEDIGLIKFDFLGLKTLDQIRDAVQLIAENHHQTIDMSALPLDDPATYAMLSSGDSLGVFQLESSGMRELLTRLKPGTIDDMVALVALYRPGPLQSGMTDDFVERKHGRVQVSYPHPSLEPILQTTYGTVIYQEQVMQIAQVIAGYSLGQADLLRRAMGKKKQEEMDKQRGIFLAGAAERNIDPTTAATLFEMMAKFAAYGFNKSHSAAYGYVSYQTAWLKANYRPEYMAALMSIESGNADKLLAYIADCRAASIRIDPVCVNQSERAFSVRPPAERDGQDAIRFGLAAVKNVGTASIEAILEARAKGGPFADAADFFERVDARKLNKRVLENLIKAGALDFSGQPRASLLAGLEQAMQHGSRVQADNRSGQALLFGGLPTSTRKSELRFPDCVEWSLSTKLAHEQQVLGMYLTGHPMQVYVTDVARFATAPLAQLGLALNDQEVRVVALPQVMRTVRTRRGDRMAFVQLQDVDAAIEGVFFASAWARSKRVIEAGEPVVVVGRVEATHDDEVKLIARSVESLKAIRARSTREVTFRLAVEELTPQALAQFQGLLKSHVGPCATRLVVRLADAYEVQLELPKLSVDPGFSFEEACLSLFGRSDAVVLS